MSRAESFQQDADDGASRGLFSKQTKTAPAVHHDEKNPAGNVVERQPLRCCYKLNNLEKTLAMSNTPHIVTATFFRGKPPINILRSRLEETVAANPWLGGRLVQDKESGLAIDVPDADKIDTERLFINVSDDIGLRVNATYSSLVGLLKEHPELTLKSIYKSIGRNEPLFRLAVAPAGEGLFAIIISMNHCLGDGHTSYSIYGMLGGGVVTSLEPERLPDSLEEITKMAGAANQSWMTSPAFLVGSLFHVLFRRVGKEPLLKHVDQDWIQQQKAANDPKTSGVPFITTNDILTSWLFDKADMQAALTAVNMRNRSQKGAGDTHAGNYEFSMLLMPQDAATPATLRQNMSRPGDFSCGRTAAPAGCYGSMRIKAAIITNWATFWKEFSIPGCTEILHLPVVDPQGPAYGYAIIFKPRADSLGVWISFRDKKTMTNLRQSEGRDGPLSADLIVASGSSDAATGTHAC